MDSGTQLSDNKQGYMTSVGQGFPVINNPVDSTILKLKSAQSPVVLQKYLLVFPVYPSRPEVF